ncbi:cyclin-dependent protein kinase inhibitor SMR1-like [Punica granatum]|uniref:Uncharacterized protein n=2 Tax=Punica granatum TaxID=22663 RepID=A0A218XRR2_PUNGR|nr:cyclin-dependent protein kinase inhibitor SMR1-like [Punica granatum]OWM87624.1 hypothetical protein CDL15_Pgr022737 [Punica granatum]PKI63723.1 hypothetical protein CRG98_015913 [Punica granatum]
MSTTTTDLQLLRDLPKLRLHVVDCPPLPEFSGSAPSATAVDCNSDAVRPEGRREDEEECRTPTSEENRIPALLSCPPAPKKPRLALSCKRKLSELDFFEIVNRAEVEEFFSATPVEPKRRRLPERIVA